MTKTTNEFGIDIIAEKEKVKYAILCIESKEPISAQIIEKALEDKEHYNCKKAAVMTNNTFSDQTVLKAYHNQVQLWDGKVLEEFAFKVQD